MTGFVERTGDSRYSSMCRTGGVRRIWWEVRLERRARGFWTEKQVEKFFLILGVTKSLLKDLGWIVCGMTQLDCV